MATVVEINCETLEETIRPMTAEEEAERERAVAATTEAEQAKADQEAGDRALLNALKANPDLSTRHLGEMLERRLGLG